MKSAHFFNLFPVLLLLVGATARADEAQEWLLKMDQAARTLSYEGIFVYRRGDRMETMRIVHGVENGKVRERLISLNGTPREITRTDDEVRCYLEAGNPDNPLVVERTTRHFPRILPDRIGELNAHYHVQLGKTSRIADYPAQAIIIKPKDSYRYGYQLWADIRNGLLLRADLIDDKNKIIEQFMFTQVNPLTAGSMANLQEMGEKGARGRRGKNEGSPTAGKPAWTVSRLPPGFKLSMYNVRQISAKPSRVEHLVYSDGWAVVSIFIERLQDRTAQKASSPPDRPDRIGAIHTYAKVLDKHRITVVGEVPAATIDMIGQSAKSLP